MQGKHLYDYAIIRVLPKVEREEFINVGVIMFSKREKFLAMKYYINKERFAVFSDETDYDYIESSLQTLQKICEGCKNGGKIAELDIPERFRWITAVKSACIQTSRPHSGFADNLGITLENLFAELVL